MHKIFLAVLLAGTAATQANAAPRDQRDQQARETKADQSHQGRAEGQRPRQTQPRRADRQTVNEPAGQANSRAQVAHPSAEPGGIDRRNRDNQAGQYYSPVARPNAHSRVKVEATQQNHQTVQPRAGNKPVSQPANPAPNLRRPVVSSVPRFGAQPPLRAEGRVTTRPQWRPNWRNNQRYDWSDYRRHHRSMYHQRSYRDPFGWRYQLFSIGWRLWPNYYSSSYWINDPWMYRLPPAPPGTRWIRYYNDVLLVDMWSGEVVDVIHNFFW